MDDDDEFLYGGSKYVPESTAATSAPQIHSSNGHPDANTKQGTWDLDDDESTPAGDEGDVNGDESEDDVEIIMEPTSRSLDLRNSTAARTVVNRPSGTVKAPQANLTTEYTLRERGAAPPQKPVVAPPPTTPPAPQPVPQPAPQAITVVPETPIPDDGPDTSNLPPAVAPPSHPPINPAIPGMMDGRSIYEVDINAMVEKPWRRPGSDISDWFNYGFDELSWEAYCYRRRELGEMANVLKTNVLNFAGMPEDQITALPLEVRQMVMAGTTAVMTGAGANPVMMGGGVPINPMMDMSGMNAMNMGAMGMGMSGDMSMQMPPGGPMMQDNQAQVQAQSAGATQEHNLQMGMTDGFGPAGSTPGMMGMGGEFGMQEPGAMGQVMYPSMDANVPAGPSGRGSGAPMYARGRPPVPAPAPGLRGRGGYTVRGRGRGGMYPSGDERPPIPVRPTSPLPPGVPTGPRNQNKYKDRDGNAPALEGLDYGGGKDGGRMESGEPEDRGARKRRSSPGLEEGRGSKRR